MGKVFIISLVTLAFALATPRRAHADVGLGVFIGDPTGLDLKLDLSRNTALDFVLGWHTWWWRDERRWWGDRAGYAHAAYLVTLFAGQGRSIVVPLRLGIGGAIYGDSDDLNVGVRVPFEVGIRFRRAPIELYGEIAPMLTFLDDGFHGHLDLQGGIGVRFYF
jgi:hypothetical protein